MSRESNVQIERGQTEVRELTVFYEHYGFACLLARRRRCTI
jgi:hypothetical protein